MHSAINPKIGDKSPGYAVILTIQGRRIFLLIITYRFPYVKYTLQYSGSYLPHLWHLSTTPPILWYLSKATHFPNPILTEYLPGYQIYNRNPWNRDKRTQVLGGGGLVDKMFNDEISLSIHLWKCGATETVIHWWECKAVQPRGDFGSFFILMKLHRFLSYNPAIMLLAIYPKELKA